MFDDFLINAVNESGVVKIAFSLLAFLGQDVAMISMLPLDSAGARQFKTFLSAGLGLHFWHFTDLLKF